MSDYENAKARVEPTWRCGHPRTAENSANIGGERRTCRICRLALRKRLGK